MSVRSGASSAFAMCWKAAFAGSGDRVRISAQLIDATTGAHRWAERYDRDLKDVFAVQDEVARTIVTILAAHLNKAEAERTLLKPPATWQAYDYYMRAADTYASFIGIFKSRRSTKHGASSSRVLRSTRLRSGLCLAFKYSIRLGSSIG